jgi:hypothetical protein
MHFLYNITEFSIVHGVARAEEHLMEMKTLEERIYSLAGNARYP